MLTRLPSASRPSTHGERWSTRRPMGHDQAFDEQFDLRPVEHHLGGLDAAGAFDPHRARTVDHHLAHVRVEHQLVDRPEAGSAGPHQPEHLAALLARPGSAPSRPTPRRGRRRDDRADAPAPDRPTGVRGSCDEVQPAQRAREPGSQEPGVDGAGDGGVEREPTPHGHAHRGGKRRPLAAPVPAPRSRRVGSRTTTIPLAARRGSRHGAPRPPPACPPAQCTSAATPASTTTVRRAAAQTPASTSRRSADERPPRGQQPEMAEPTSASRAARPSSGTLDPAQPVGDAEVGLGHAEQVGLVAREIDQQGVGAGGGRSVGRWPQRRRRFRRHPWAIGR